MVATSTMILSSLISIGEKSIGGSLSSAEQAHYLNKFNAFLDSLATERLLVPYITTDSFSLSAGTSSYSIGTGATVNTARPVKLLGAYIRQSDNTDIPIKVIELDNYSEIVNKLQTGAWPEVVYYDGGFSATSSGTLVFAPVPTSTATVFLNSQKQFASVSTVTQDVQLPPGYQRMIESNFAIECSPGLIDPPAALVKIARDSRAAVKGINLPSPTMRLDTGIVKSIYRGNILDG